jgi:hypothetical protein
MHRYKAKVHIKNSMNGVKLDQTQIFTIEAENKSQAKEIIYKRYAYIPRQNISVVVHKKF